MRFQLNALIGMTVATLASIACCGCNLFQTGTKNLLHEPIYAFEQTHLTQQLRKEGKLVYRDFAARYPEWCSGAEFEDGFVDGYADYLDRGGKGDPPAIPPLHYRHNKYLSPEGIQAIDRYFAGFASGARVAKESGRRDVLVVPILVPADSPGGSGPATGAASTGPAAINPGDPAMWSAPTAGAGAAAPTLPPPRPPVEEIPGPKPAPKMMPKDAPTPAAPAVNPAAPLGAGSKPTLPPGGTPPPAGSPADAPVPPPGLIDLTQPRVPR